MSQSFYLRDTRLVARDLIGCCLVRLEPRLLIAQIVETEAYLPDDAASHSYRGPTPRSAVMFGPAGHAYVYFIYGNHYCFNVVTGAEGYGAAVLIRAAIPLVGIAEMSQHRVHRPPQSSDRPIRSNGQNKTLCNGPGKLTQAFAITREQHNGCSLVRTDAGLLLLSAGVPAGGMKRREIVVLRDRRVGVSRSRDAQGHLRRYLAADCSFVSRKPGPNAQACTTANDHWSDAIIS